MATILFYRRNLFPAIWLLFSAVLFQAHESAEISFDESPEGRQPFWKAMGSDFHLDENPMDTDQDYDEENSYQEEDASDELKDFDERGVIYPEARAVVHKVCKVRTIPVRLSYDGYEYSSSHFKNLTCEETNDKPLERKVPQSNEYCLIVHHPHQRVNCHTKHTYVPMFRRKSRKHPWEKVTQTVAVGCDCSVGLKYL